MNYNALEYRFNIADQSWKGFLLDNGFVVIKEIVPRQAADQYLSRLWSDMEELSSGRVSRDDVNTRLHASNYPYMIHGGMIQYLGHSQLQWDIREAVAPVFASLYGVDVTNLSTSFDGLCFMDGERKYRTKSQISFLHADQAPSKKFRYSIQGLLNLVDNGPDDGGFVCVPGSHLYTEYWDDHPARTSTDDWYLFTDAEKRNDPMFDQSIKVCCAAGDIVLWDSRTWYCNTVPTSKQLRACTYICMLPKQYVPAEVRTTRAAALMAGRVTSHHPGLGLNSFRKNHDGAMTPHITAP